MFAYAVCTEEHTMLDLTHHAFSGEVQFADIFWRAEMTLGEVVEFQARGMRLPADGTFVIFPKVPIPLDGFFDLPLPSFLALIFVSH